MSFVAVSPIDFSKFEAQNMVIQNLALAPASPVEGQLYYDTSNDNLYVYTTAGWVDCTGAYTGGDGIDVTALSIDVDSTVARRNADNTIAGNVLASKATTGSNPVVSGVTSSTGYGVYGSTNSGIGVVGVGTSGRGIAAQSATGIGISSLASGSQAAIQAVNDSTGPAFKVESGHGSGAAFDANGEGKLINLVDGTAAQDAVTVAQLQALSAGIDVHSSVRVASTANIATISTGLAAGQVIDGVTLIAGDRVLLKNQSTPSQNGLWVSHATTPFRATDADAAGDLSGGSFVFVEEGTVGAETGWIISTNGSITPGTTAHTWQQFSGPGTYTAGAGITLSSNAFSVDTAIVVTKNADNTIAGNVLASKVTTGTNPVVSGTTSSSGIGVQGSSTSGRGIDGVATTGWGVYGVATTGIAGLFSNASNASPAVSIVNTGTAGVLSLNGSNSTGQPVFDVQGGSSAAASSFLSSGTGPAIKIGTGHGTGAAIDINAEGKIIGLVDGTGAQDGATFKQAGYTFKANCGTSATWTITHSLNTLDVMVEVVRVSDGRTVLADVVRTGVNAVDVIFGTAPTAAQYRALIRSVN